MREPMTYKVMGMQADRAQVSLTNLVAVAARLNVMFDLEAKVVQAMDDARQHVAMETQGEEAQFLLRP